jgi:hypothetical protein
MTQAIELWTNDSFSEFGIKLNSETVVTTRQDAILIKLIDKTKHNNSYDRQWQYTLAQWTIFYLANRHLTSKFSKKTNFKGVLIDQIDRQSMDFYDQYLPKKRPRPQLKCHYCNLKYCLETQRQEHEEFWHDDKLHNV